MNETYGQSSPQTLLWTFMGASAPYTFFAGAMETIGGALLYFRRTATLGALIVTAVMTNIVMMNFCYDVPVKQYSLNLLLMAVALVVPDLRHLADFFLLHRRSRLPDAGLHFSSPRMRTAAHAAKVLLIGSAIYRTTSLASEAVHAYGPLAPKHPLYGHYEVEEFVMNGEALPPVLTDARRWRTLTVATRGFVVVRAMNDSKTFFQLGPDVIDGRITLTSTAGAKEPHEVVLRRVDAEHLVLEGRFTDDAIAARLKKVEEASYPLVGREFRWVKEFSD